MDWKLQVVPVPVTDVDRALAFYRDRCGFAVDHDTPIDGGTRIVQLTPPGSDCSIVLGVSPMPPGSLQGLQFVVSDVAAARAQLVERGATTSPVQHFEAGGMVDGPGGPWNSFVSFADPDGNGWVLQERP